MVEFDTCPYPHCLKPLENRDSQFHEECGRRLQVCNKCDKINTVFATFCSKCGGRLPEFKSWAAPFGNGLNNRSADENFLLNVSFSEKWRKDIHVEIDVSSPEFICAGDLILIHNQSTRSLEGYSLITDIHQDPIFSKSWSMTRRAYKAMSPLQIDRYAIFADGTNKEARLVIINLLTLTKKLESLSLKSPLNSNYPPLIIGQYVQDDVKEYMICYITVDTLNYYKFNTKDTSFKLIYQIPLDKPFQSSGLWYPISFLGQTLYLTKTGHGIITTLYDNNEIDYSNFELDLKNTYFQPSIFIDRNKSTGNLTHLMIPVKSNDFTWSMLFSNFGSHWNHNLLNEAKLETNFEPSTFYCTALNTSSGAIYLQSDTFFHFSFRDNGIRYPSYTVSGFSEIDACKMIAGAKNMLFAYDRSGNLLAINPISHEKIDTRNLNSTSKLASCPVYTDGFVVVQNNKEVICLKI